MRKVTVALIALIFTGIAAAADASEATVKAAFEKKFPNIPVESVTKTPLPGIYEVFANGEIVYADEKAAFLFVRGELIDVDRKTSITEERTSKLTAIKFDELPLSLAFKKVKGKGTRRFAYFGDPNCGYCKKFEENLTKLNDVTIYVFLYPVLGPDSIEKAKSIWCSKDRAKAWDDQLVRGVAPTAPATCDTSTIDKTLAFGRDKKISGTPTIFFADGQRVPGMMPLEIMEQRLAAATPSK
jgi:thiol:disulfide interchange protein DsbC